MDDMIDMAQAAEQYDRDQALRAQAIRCAESFAPRQTGIDGTCIDCDGVIEPERLSTLGRKTSRCASCAQDHEMRIRGQR